MIDSLVGGSSRAFGEIMKNQGNKNIGSICRGNERLVFQSFSHVFISSKFVVLT